MPPRCKNPNAPEPDDPGWLHYVEPFFGGGAVLFAMNPDGIGEVVNDLDGDLTNFWRVLQDPHIFPMFRRAVSCIPCSESEFTRMSELLRQEWEAIPFPQVQRAAAFFVNNRQSRQALGRDFATLARTRTRRGMNELPSAWLTAIDGLWEVHQRLQRVVILNDKAVDVIRQQDGPRTFFYLDPPYVHETRSTTGEYQHEMSRDDHERLLATLSGTTGRFILSGYRSGLYEAWADNCRWRRIDIAMPNNASSKDAKERKTECLWLNY